jgi:hypothetical protein|tara:strand:+ start:214 stop:405 length:192 start_codon:yes stop_codon:yes gene_type:complete
MHPAQTPHAEDVLVAGNDLIQHGNCGLEGRAGSMRGSVLAPNIGKDGENAAGKSQGVGKFPHP